MTYMIVKGFSILIKGMKPDVEAYTNFTFRKGTLLEFRDTDDYGSIFEFSTEGSIYEIYLYRKEIATYTIKYVSANEIWKELNEN